MLSSSFKLAGKYFFCLLTMLAAACSAPKKTSVAANNNKIYIDDGTAQPAAAAPPKEEIKKANSLQEKYALYLKTSPASVTNVVLYQFIDQWLFTPYLWGGTSRKGIDCSAFMQKLLSEVYKIRVPRTSFEQFGTGWIDRFASTKSLSEGDLVFFKTMDDKIVSHVGMYLANRMFINASSSKGVSIACMDDAYWKKRFVAAGRLRPGMHE
ncbi:MAG: C40 family peptidase [Bacteroidota bacterium]